jgi:hypothetical protein
MNRRNAGIAVAAIAVIAIVIVVALMPRPDTVVVASPSPTLSIKPSATATGTTAPTASTAASASPAATASGSIYNDAFGFLVTGGDGPPHAVIYKEGSDAQLGTIGTQAFAVSPDGTRVAYFTLFASGPELHVLTVGANAEQSLVTLGAGQRAGGVAWSSDGTALLYSTETGSFGIGGGTNSATLNIWELAGNGRHGTTIDTQANTGWLYRPIAWDRSANLAAAQLTGEGGYMGMYETVRINADNSFNVSRADARSTTMSSIRASSDAKYVLGVGGPAGDIAWWPIDNFGAAKSQTGAGKRGAQWRPGTHEIGFLSAEQFWLGDVDKAGALGLCCTAFGGVPASSTLATFRADGTAVVLGVPAPSRQFGADYTLVRLGGDPKATSGDRVTFQALTGLAASVRLR